MAAKKKTTAKKAESTEATTTTSTTTPARRHSVEPGGISPRLVEIKEQTKAREAELAKRFNTTKG